RLIHELDGEKGRQLFQKNAGRREFLLIKAQLVLCNILLSRNKLGDIPALLQQCQERSHYRGMEMVVNSVQAAHDLILYSRHGESHISNETLTKHLTELEKSVEKGYNGGRYTLAQLHIALGNRQGAEEVLSHDEAMGVRVQKLRALNLFKMESFQEACQIYQLLEGQPHPGIYSTLVDYAVCMKEWGKTMPGEPGRGLFYSALCKFQQGIEQAPPKWDGGWNCIGHFLSELNEEQLGHAQCRRQLPSPLHLSNRWSQAASMAFNIANSIDLQQTIDDYKRLPAQDFDKYTPLIRHDTPGSGSHGRVISSRWRRSDVNH
ncbi:hypothetical protein, partial [Sansalvadorimonas verongulae]|uniref:hypothetical protein n=1 Tax=Sansalvadorimonas verongulae TaxID=2172824 RepID=UPI0018AD1740